MRAAHAAENDRERRLERLTVLGPNHPRVFHFRGASEGAAANPEISYDQWKARITDLMGVIGKALDEEIPGRSLRNPEFYSRFKREHPDKLVLLHFNGSARDPRFDGGKFFAGHWVYFPATQILSDAPAEHGETDRVARVSRPVISEPTGQETRATVDALDRRHVSRRFIVCDGNCFAPFPQGVRFHLSTPVL